MVMHSLFKHRSFDIFKNKIYHLNVRQIKAKRDPHGGSSQVDAPHKPTKPLEPKRFQNPEPTVQQHALHDYISCGLHSCQHGRLHNGPPS